MYEIYTVYDEVLLNECLEIHPRVYAPYSRDSCMELCLDIPNCRGVKIEARRCYFYDCDCTDWDISNPHPTTTLKTDMFFMYRYCINSRGNAECII